jgi:hypothetical protein
MTDFTDLKAQIAEWANREDWSDTLIASFISQAEQKFNSDLRVDRMIETAQNLVTLGSAELPDDWLQTDLLLIASSQTPTGWLPLRYKQRDEFFRLPNTPPGAASYRGSENSTVGYYTIEGRVLFFGGPVDSLEGTPFQMSYYSEVPSIAAEGTSWIYTKYPSLYLYGSLMHADLHAVGEEDKAVLLSQQVDAMIQKLNMAHQYAKASGSPLARVKRHSFG